MLAVSVFVPPTVGVTTTVAMRVAPEVMSFSQVQVKTPPLGAVQLVAVGLVLTDWNVDEAGNVIVMTGFVAFVELALYPVIV